MSKDIRPIFYYKNNMVCELKAGGVILYKYENKNVKFLMIHSNNKYEDFGGRTDNHDKNIEETIAREAEEESNKILDKKSILNEIHKYKNDVCDIRDEIDELEVDELEKEFNLFLGNTINKPNNRNIIKEVYSKPSKYLIYIIPTTINYDPNSFGDREIHDNIRRTVEWVSYEFLTDQNTYDNKLHFRLKSKQFMDAITEIYNKRM